MLLLLVVRLMIITQRSAMETGLIRSLVVWVCNSVTENMSGIRGLESHPPNHKERKITICETSI